MDSCRHGQRVRPPTRRISNEPSHPIWNWKLYSSLWSDRGPGSIFFIANEELAAVAGDCSEAPLTLEELLAEEAQPDVPTTSDVPTANGAQAENRSHWIFLLNTFFFLPYLVQSLYKYWIYFVYFTIRCDKNNWCELCLMIVWVHCMVHLLVYLVVEEEMYFCAVYWVVLSKFLLKFLEIYLSCVWIAGWGGHFCYSHCSWRTGREQITLYISL